MSVGEALAEARSRAGLSVDELSERTRIRTAVIRCIEHDDYDACGGDVFVRGYVRALAGAVGIDARPLISEFNKARVESSGEAHVTHVARISNQVPPADPGATAADPPAAWAPDPGLTVADLPVMAADLPGATAGPVGTLPPADPDATVADLPVVGDDPAPTVDDLPVIPAEPAPPLRRPRVPGPPARWVPGDWVAESPGPRGNRARPRSRHPVARVAVPAALVVAAAGVGAGLAATSQSAPPAKSATAFSQHTSHAAASPGGGGNTANKSAAEASSPASASPTSPAPANAASQPPANNSPATPAPVTSLHIASAEAFGPAGLADGDNPQAAQHAISHGSTSPWLSQWYATADFGNLKQGTGLLIDMGRQVTVTSMRIDLAGYRGANLQVRVGDAASSPSGMRIAARAHDAGGTVRLRFSVPEHVRYLLIWFTQLPPNGAGQYQAAVYHVVVNGRP